VITKFSSVTIHEHSTQLADISGGVA